MDILRLIISVVIFCISTYLIYDLVVNGFSWPVLIVCISGFLVTHYIWPDNKIKDNIWFDLLEIIIELPFRTISLLLRSIGKLIRGSDGDIGIDL